MHLYEYVVKERPLIVLPKLATAIGLNEAIVVQQVRYWTEKFEDLKSNKHYHDGYWWVWNSVHDWRTNFPFWSERTIKRTLKAMREPIAKSEKHIGREPLLVVGNYNSKGYDRTLWYRVDWEALERYIDRYEETKSDNVTPIEMG